MLLEVTEFSTAVGRSLVEPTASGQVQAFVPPSVIKPLVDTSGSNAPITEKKPSADGVRILDGIAPMERARMAHHHLSSRLEVLQSWEGYVTVINPEDGSFTARLYDLTNPGSSVSEAELEIADVSENDRDLLKIGGVFRWMIGYRRHDFGQRERISAIVFRRLPTWTGDDLVGAMEEGERLAASLAVE